MILGGGTKQKENINRCKGDSGFCWWTQVTAGKESAKWSHPLKQQPNVNQPIWRGCFHHCVSLIWFPGRLLRLLGFFERRFFISLKCLFHSFQDIYLYFKGENPKLVSEKNHSSNLKRCGITDKQKESKFFYVDYSQAHSTANELICKLSIFSL